MEIKEFKAGDKVYCTLLEKVGVVLSIKNSEDSYEEEDYPLCVYWGNFTDPKDIEEEIDNDSDVLDHYTLEGQIFTSPCNRTLFHYDDVKDYVELVADKTILLKVAAYHEAICKDIYTRLLITFIQDEK